MKLSYNTLKRYLPEIGSPEEVAEKLINHVAEVESIEKEGENLKDVYIAEIIDCQPHPDGEKLSCTQVKLGEKIYKVVCGAPNVRKGIKVPLAVVGARLSEDFIIEKTKIRGETSEGMICSEDELGFKEERQSFIMELPNNAPLGISMRDYLSYNTTILEVDNKAINHRPDLFSHIGFIRELSTIYNLPLREKYIEEDFSSIPSLNIKNEISEVVRRYIGLKLSLGENGNKETPEDIKQVINAGGVTSKGILIDITNYSLYLYGQPTHCFDADKIKGNITIRYARDGETILALDDKEYKLSGEDIVIADDTQILALGGVIGAKYPSVSDTTQNIIIESANFDQAVVRKTGRRLGVRTDSLNVFEKNIPLQLAINGVSLINNKLKNVFPKLKMISYDDVYPVKQPNIEIPFDLDYINNLIGSNYSEEYVLNILDKLGIILKNEKLYIPYWRLDITNKSDIAEEIARIDGYDNVKPTIPRINLGAVIQDDIYKLKNDARKFFTDRGFFDMYNYSFVNEKLMERINSDTSSLVALKNSLSEDATHMKGSHIPNLMASLESNIRTYPKLNLFEVEKVFSKNSSGVKETYYLSGVSALDKKIIPYYEIQKIISDFFSNIGVDKFYFDEPKSFPSFAHRGRTGSIIVRGQEIGYIGEIHPSIVSDFGISGRVGFWELDLSRLGGKVYNTTKYREISSFQENNFDLSFVVDKSFKGRKLEEIIKGVDKNLIQKVELFDIYENEEKLPGQRSLSFKIFIQSINGTISDNIKGELLKKIIDKGANIGAKLRS